MKSEKKGLGFEKEIQQKSLKIILPWRHLHFFINQIPLGYTYNFRLEWRLNFTIFNFFPVNSTEKAVISDIFFAMSTAAQSLHWVFGQELLGEIINLCWWISRENFSHPFANIFRFFGQTLWIWDVVVSDGCKELFFIFTIKWRLPNEHFIQQYAIRPPIDWFSVRLV